MAKTKTPTFTLDRVIPVIEGLISALSSRHGHASRDAIVSALIDDAKGKQLVKDAQSKNTASWSERQVAGNMVDWFSANYAVGARLTESARSRFDRTKVNGKWSYHPKGTAPLSTRKATVSNAGANKKRQRVAAAHPVSAAFSFPRTFISYSHDSGTHKDWVERLAKNLVANGVDVSLDQWDIEPSTDVAAYMERAVRDSDWVIVVCTDSYVAKANSGKGGAGYEKMIMTAELVRNQTKKKFIPIVRTTNFPTVPTFLESKIYIDFTDDNAYVESVESLLRTVHSAPRVTKPSIGVNPFAPGGSGKPIIA